MATLSKEQQVTSKKRWWEYAGRVLALLFVVGITVGIALERDEIEHLPVYGYPAVFIVSLLGNASVIVPAPSFAIAFVAGSALNPIGVGLVAGLGAALGELTGYLAGLSGKGIVENRWGYSWIQRSMKKSGALIIFILGAVPNFLFDVGGIIAGTVRMPIWQFLLAAWLGKSIRLGIVALTGSMWF
jgi:membrane protein YqaA with SNARE-associated domain